MLKEPGIYHGIICYENSETYFTKDQQDEFCHLLNSSKIKFVVWTDDPLTEDKIYYQNFAGLTLNK